MNFNKYLIVSIVCFLLMPLMSSSQVTLSVDNSLIHKTFAQSSTTVVFDVQEKKSNCIQLLGSNPGQTAQSLGTGDNTMSSGGQADILCVALLNNVVASNDGRMYEFSPGCAENDKTSASVEIVFGSSSAEVHNPIVSQTSFKIDITAADILAISNNNTPIGATNQQKYLKVDASPANAATISIEQDDNRGQCYIALISATSATVGTLAVLDPKSASNRSYVSNQAVYVVPVLRPKSQRAPDGLTELIYEIGDPERNGKVRVEEI